LSPSYTHPEKFREGVQERAVDERVV
jgi:hypothetical protein